MFAGNQDLLTTQQDCSSVVAQVTAALNSAGFYVLQSFDLHSAVKSGSDCMCAPDACTCQMVVLLVYAQDGPPATLVFDGDEVQTTVSLVSDISTTANVHWTDRLAQIIPGTVFPAGTSKSGARMT